MTRERRLGRGLEALLGQMNHAGNDSFDNQGQPPSGVPNIGVYEIDSNPFQPRRDFDDAELDQLCQSLQQHGLLQPITVRRMNDRYQLVAGERRLRAAIKAGWQSVPAQVLEVDDRQMSELAIVENLQRKDLNALEKAASFQDYLQRYQCTQEELAGRLQIDRSTVANLIRLLELPQQVQSAVRSGSISAGHARALLPLGDENEQVAACQKIVDEGLSVRAVEALVQQITQEPSDPSLRVVGSDAGATPTRARNEQIESLEQELRHALGLKVEVKTGAKGKGKLVLHFKSHDEFERLRALLTTPGHYQQAG